MKYKFSVVASLLAVFLIIQFIGLAVVNSYSGSNLPYGMQPPEVEKGTSLVSIIISFVIAVTLILILAKYKWKFLIRAWFFVVVVLAIAISLNSLLKDYTSYSYLIVLALALPLGFLKIYRQGIIIHNLTELLIYPGIAAVFVPILSPLTIIILLVLISVYDMWAVWHSKIMIKMAKFQMNELKIFAGLLIPDLSKKVRMQISKIKKSKKSKNKKIQVSLAILGGGDIVFPAITAGVFLRAFSIVPALFVLFGALAGLAFLFLISEKKKFYPAMPFITGGIFLALIIWKIFLF